MIKPDKLLLFFSFWAFSSLSEFTFGIKLTYSKEYPLQPTAQTTLCPGIAHCPTFKIPIDHLEILSKKQKALPENFKIQTEFNFQELVLLKQLISRENISVDFKLNQTKTSDSNGHHHIINVSIETNGLMTILAFPIQLHFLAFDQLLVKINIISVHKRYYYKGFALILGSPSIFKEDTETDNLFVKSYVNEGPMKMLDNRLPLKIEDLEFNFITEYNISQEKPYLVALIFDNGNFGLVFESIKLMREGKQLKNLLNGMNNSSKTVFVFGCFSGYVVEEILPGVKGKADHFNELHITTRKLLFDRIAMKLENKITKIEFYEGLKGNNLAHNNEIEEFKKLWRKSQRYSIIPESDFKKMNIFRCASNLREIDKNQFVHPMNWISFQNKLFFEIKDPIDGDKAICSNEQDGKDYLVVFKANSKLLNEFV